MSGSDQLVAALRRVRRRRAPRERRAGWWPQISPAQASGLAGIGVTVALALYDQLKRRLGAP